MNTDLRSPIQACSPDDPYEDFGSRLFRFSALTTTRRTSQVCRYWREVILGSPSLWGRAIDLDHLKQKKPRWRNEVLRRTGDASLFVKGSSVETASQADFLLSLLDMHWSRIREFYVTFRFEAKSILDDERWGVIQTPAQDLQSFTLVFWRYTPRVLSSTNKAIFSDNAPSLRKFHCPAVALNLQAPWLSQLRRMELENPPFTVQELLVKLGEMPLLEYVRLNKGIRATLGDSSLSELPCITLPRLENIVILNTFENGISLLDHISPATGCGLSLAIHPPILPSDAYLAAAHRCLSRYLQSICSSHTVDYLYMDVEFSGSGYVTGRTFQREGTPIDASTSHSRSALSMPLVCLECRAIQLFPFYSPYFPLPNLPPSRH
ncbi:hypothetical protein BDZ97DRAFT_811493 [Flammula alnicola]|nr:hypothetical protein BDZ97DRAFT_811493 [Flammula alnicola]